MNKGKIVQVMGPVVDVVFEDGQLPDIKDALEVENNGKRCVMEVSQHLGNNIVRCIMLGASEGLQRDREVTATGSGIKVPVGDKTLGRLFNVLGDTVDGGDSLDGEEHWVIHRDPPSFEEQKPAVEILETGIKVIDLLAPYAKKEVPKDEEMRSYMKNLMGIMEQSIQQFRESNDRFTALSSLVKEHVVEEKNQEIKDLYENLQYKDKNIQELKEKLAKKEQEIQDLKKEAEKYREKTEAASRETKVVLEEKSIQTAEGLQKSKHRLLGIAMLGKKVPKSVVEKILEYNLSAEQLEEIRQCVESGLADAEILQVMENSPSPERMKKMREIILLMRKRKAGV